MVTKWLQNLLKNPLLTSAYYIKILSFIWIIYSSK